MSDNEESTEKSFCIDVAKQSRATCKKCKQKLLAGEIRIAKLAPNPFGEGKMKNWHHPKCIFEQFLKQRVTTKRIECPDDLDGWDLISDDKQQAVIEMIEESNKNIAEKYNLKIKSPIKIEKNSKTPKTPEGKQSMEEKPMSQEKRKQVNSNRDNSFREFRRLVADITNVSAYLEKTAKVKEFLTKGNDKQSFKGDTKLWVRLLLPGVIKRIYNLQSRQLIKLFSRILNTNQDDMLEHLEQGDISETISYYFTQSKNVEIPKKSELSLQEIDEFLEELSNLTKEDDQTDHFRNILPKCTENDLKTLIRLIKGDLRMNAGAKHILDGIHPDAYEVYKASKNIDTVLDRCLSKNHKTTNIKATISLLTPVQPMLAEACKSVEQAMAKCPNGMYSEIKYDGERVQIHKSGKEFKYFSRALKPVVPHKVSHLKDYISKAFPSGEDLILDSEILLVEHETGKPLPFGTLGVHKKSEFKDANVCLFVFDCIYYNGEDLMSRPLSFRKKVLKDNMIEIKNHVVFSEMEEINKIDDLRNMIAKTLQLGLEGLVLKDTKSIYEPGKRHWLKVKKDYLFDGAMADTADLIVLGAWYGTGKKGGMMSVFLMGCYDRNRDRFCTVTKVHTGHDDKTLEKLQSELDMVKTAEIPDWLSCSKPMVPDLIARDPKNQPVWEITGAEFTQHQVHTAKGISIRFPRVTRIRNDKTWKEATDLDELEKLMKESKSNTDYSTLLMGTPSTSNSSLNSNLSKRKSDQGIESPPKKIQKKISGIFADVKLLCVSEAGEILKETVKKFEDNSGLLLNSDSSKSATHVLHDKDREVVMRNLDCPKTANHVIADWVDDCITKNKLLSDREYRVILDSNLDRNDDSDEGFHS